MLLLLLIWIGAVFVIDIVGVLLVMLIALMA